MIFAICYAIAVIASVLCSDYSDFLSSNIALNVPTSGNLSNDEKLLLSKHTNICLNIGERDLSWRSFFILFSQIL